MSHSEAADARWKVGDPAPEPLPRRSEADVTARWSDGPPLVSILCPTYQHVDFIEDALRGFLGQDTDFPFEIIVRDDASTDGTAEIVADYAERYPSIVRAILEEWNTFGVQWPLQTLEGAARGQFIATCEGDDFWCNPNKLATQVLLLQGDNRLAVVGHETVEIAADRVTQAPISTAAQTLRRVSARSLRQGEGHGLHTSAIAYRRTPWPESLFSRRITNFDVLRNSWFGTLGDGGVLDGFVGSVYRRHPGGWQTGADLDEQRQRSIMSRYWSSRVLRDLGVDDAADAFAAGAQLALASQLGVADARGVARLADRIIRRGLVDWTNGSGRLNPVRGALRMRRRLRRLLRG